MSEWVDVASLDEFKQDNRKILEYDDFRILVIKHHDDFFAIDSICTHAMFELDDAEIEGDNIICPLHGAKFCIKTGKVKTAPAYEDLEHYPVRVENNIVQVDIS